MRMIAAYWSKNIRRLIFFVALCSIASLSSVVYASDLKQPDCAVDLAQPELSLLSLAGAPDGRLDANTVATLTETLGVTKTSPRLKSFEHTKGIVEELVSEGKITNAEAENLFSEKMLGEFSSIFLKFVVAELAERKFSQDDVSNFLIHFDSAFRPDRQVEFAAAVARRMLVTINTDTEISTPEGLHDFLNSVKAFQVESETYSEFMQVWAFVSKSRPATILRFILANIKNTGKYVNERKMAERAERAAASATKPNWFSRWVSPIPKLDQAPVDSVLSVASIPKFIRDLRFLEPPKDAPNFLELSYGIGGVTSGVILGTRRPQVVNNHLVINHLGLMNYSVIEELISSAAYQSLDESVRAQVEGRLSQFDAFRTSAQGLESQIARVKAERQAARDGRKRPATTDRERAQAQYLLDVVIHRQMDEYEYANQLLRCNQPGVDVRNVLFALADGYVSSYGPPKPSLHPASQAINRIRLLFFKSQKAWHPDDLSKMLFNLGSVKIKHAGAREYDFVRKFIPDTLNEIYWSGHVEATSELAADKDDQVILSDEGVQSEIIALQGVLKNTYGQSITTEALGAFFVNRGVPRDIEPDREREEPNKRSRSRGPGNTRMYL